MSESDIYSLFGNALDNAIEASSQTKEKFIVINIASNKQKIEICIENSSNPVELHNNTIFTTKQDAKNHGLGLSSIIRTLDKYNGKLYISYNNGITKCFMSLDNPQF